MKSKEVCCIVCLTGSAAFAQCPGQWVPGIGTQGLNGTVYALANWDPDGAGPMPARLAVGGDFTTAGGPAANRVAWWNPSTGAWSALGTGVSGTTAPVVYALAVLPSGDLAVGGYFTSAGSVTVQHTAAWNGAWYNLFMFGMNDRVRALAVMSDGRLVAGGDFTQAGFVMQNRIARLFDSTSGWVGFGAGLEYDVYGLAATPDGSVYAAEVGSGGSPDHLARWNGSSWVSLGTGILNSVRCVAALPNGNIVAGGTFPAAGGTTVNYVARWNGTAWSSMGGGMNNYVNALAAAPNGDVYAGGYFTIAGGVPANRVAKWNGSAWEPLGVGVGSGVNDVVNAIALMPGGDVVVGGAFAVAGGATANRIARWNQPGPCYANCDCSTAAPILNANDFQCFLTAFAGGGSYPNCDGSSVNPVLTANDFQCFLNKFALGCS